MGWSFLVVLLRFHSCFRRPLETGWVDCFAFQNCLHHCVSDALSPFCSSSAWWCFWRLRLFCFWTCLLQEGERPLTCLISFRSSTSSLNSSVLCIPRWHLSFVCLTALAFLAVGHVGFCFISCLLGDLCFSVCRHVGLLQWLPAEEAPSLLEGHLAFFPAVEGSFVYWTVAEDALWWCDS